MDISFSLDHKKLKYKMFNLTLIFGALQVLYQTNFRYILFKLIFKALRKYQQRQAIFVYHKIPFLFSILH